MLFPKPAFGLDISDRSIKAISLSSDRGKKILGMAYLELPEGIVEKGEIRNSSLLSQSIRLLLEENIRYGKISGSCAIAAIPEAQTYIHPFSVPASVSEENILSFLEEEASRSIPLLPEERISDYRIFAKGAENREVLYVAALRTLVQVWHDAISQAGITPLILEPELEALARSVSAEYNSSGAYLLTDIGARSSDIGVIEAGHVHFSSSVPVGGDRFTEAIARSLQLTFDEAEAVKCASGLLPEPQEGKVMHILQKELQDIIRELERIRAFFKEREGTEIQGMLLAGGSSLMPGIAEYLAENLGISVRVGDPWVSIDISPLMDSKETKTMLEVEPILYGASIGSALRGIKRNPEREGLNLLHNFHPNKGRVSNFFGRFSGKK